MGSVSVKKPYFSSKREGVLVFIPNGSPWCGDYISVETQASFNLAPHFFPLCLYTHKCFLKKYKLTTSVKQNKEFRANWNALTKKNTRHLLISLNKADKTPASIFKPDLLLFINNVNIYGSKTFIIFWNNEETKKPFGLWLQNTIYYTHEKTQSSAKG